MKKNRIYERRGLVFVTLIYPLGEFDEDETFTSKSHLSCINNEGKEVGIVVSLGELYDGKYNISEKITKALKELGKDESYISMYLESVYLNIPKEKITK